MSDGLRVALNEFFFATLEAVAGGRSFEKDREAFRLVLKASMEASAGPYVRLKLKELNADDSAAEFERVMRGVGKHLEVASKAYTQSVEGDIQLIFESIEHEEDSARRNALIKDKLDAIYRGALSDNDHLSEYLDNILK